MLINEKDVRIDSGKDVDYGSIFFKLNEILLENEKITLNELAELHAKGNYMFKLIFMLMISLDIDLMPCQNFANILFIENSTTPKISSTTTDLEIKSITLQFFNLFKGENIRYEFDRGKTTDISANFCKFLLNQVDYIEKSGKPLLPSKRGFTGVTGIM